MKKIILVGLTGVMLSFSAFSAKVVRSTGTAANDEKALDKEVVKDAVHRSANEHETQLNSKTSTPEGRGDFSGSDKQEEQEDSSQAYREDGFEDIQSDSYIDNGNGSTTNPKVNP